MSLAAKPPYPCVVNINTHRFDVYCGRNPRLGDTRWGNPYTHLPLGRTGALWRVPDVKTAISGYANWVVNQPKLMLDVGGLWGKVLGCHCVDDPARFKPSKFEQNYSMLATDMCHAQFIMRMANYPWHDPRIAERFRVEILPPGSSTYLVCMVMVDEYSRIMWTADVLGKFIGQDLDNLLRWGKCSIAPCGKS